MSSAVLEARLRFTLTDELPVLCVCNGTEGLLGFAVEDFLSSKVSLKERIHKDDSDLAEMLFSPQMQVSSSDFNIRIRHADGRIRCIRGHYSKETSDGAVTLDLLLQDVKSLRASQGEQSTSLSFRAMMENSEDYIFFKDGNCVLTAVSRTLETTAIYPLQHGSAVVGGTDYDTYDEETADSFYQKDMQIITGLSSEHMLQGRLNRQGQQIWLDVCKYPLRNDDGEIIGLFGMSRDITVHMKAEEALQESIESLRESQRIAGLGSYVLNVRTGEWTSSEVLDEVFGIDKEYARSLDGWTELIHPDDRVMMVAYLAEEVVGKRGEFNKEYRILRQRDRGLRWVHGLGRLVLDAEGQPVRMRGTVQDITESKQTEERLRLAANVFTNAREGIMITAVDGTIVEVNETFCAITGYSRDEILGKNPRLLKSGRQTAEFYAEMWKTLIRRGHWSGEVWNRSKTGGLFAAMLTISAVLDENGDVRQYVALLSDITALKEHKQQLEHIAHYDTLTGLPNRVLLEDRLQQAMAQANRRGQLVAVAYLDLDGFKTINDQHGHQAGDQLLMAVANRMKLALREGDTLARLGGDEFVAVMIDIASVEASVPVLARLLEAAGETERVGNLVLHVSASVGVVFYPQEEAVDADQLLRQADQAMYQAKIGGKNRYHIFDPRHDRSIRSRYADIERVRCALAAREFVLYYQPKVNMGKGTVIGAEALIRWQHPELGLLPPAVFLPLIEDHTLAIEVGEWVINTALTQMERWKAVGLDIPVSVNVGARQLQDVNFVDRLAAILSSHPHVKPSNLELEILETSALHDVAQVSEMLTGCREIGVSFSLDDFGTGYSSLSYLKGLPANVLKIDQSFVRDILVDPEDLTILEGVLGLATAYRRQAIAEGVETVEHGLMLLRLGCELAQGYGIARPMPADLLPDWAAHWHPDSSWHNVVALSPEGRQLLYADVEHRSWILAIEAFLKNDRHIPPRLGLQQCRFSAWLANKAQANNRTQPEFHTLEKLHQKLHALAPEIVKLQAQGKNAEGLARMSELDALRNALQDELKSLQKKS